MDEFVWSDQSIEDREQSLSKYFTWWLRRVGKSKDGNSIFGLGNGDSNIYFGKPFDTKAPVLRHGDVIRYTPGQGFELIR